MSQTAQYILEPGRIGPKDLYGIFFSLLPDSARPPDCSSYKPAYHGPYFHQHFLILLLHVSPKLRHALTLIRGATVTLTNRDGALLTAFLALFVTFVGRSFWRIFCFVAHRTLSTSAAQDGLYHQTQAVLRNADESIAGLKYFVLLAWNWRKKSTRLWLRFIPLIGVATVVTIGFFVASVFSSQVGHQCKDPHLEGLFCQNFLHCCCTRSGPITPGSITGYDPQPISLCLECCTA